MSRKILLWSHFIDNSSKMSIAAISKRRLSHNLALLTERELYQQICIRNHTLNNNVKLKPKISFLSKTNDLIRRRPIITGTSIAVFKSIFADYLTQRMLEHRSFDEIDWKRNLCFGVFGFGYTGLICYGIYAKLYPYLFQNIFKNVFNTNIKQTIGQILIDQFIHSPLIYMPVFYCLKGFIYNGSMSKALINSSLNEYFCTNIKKDILALWMVWIPANMLTFTIIPLHLRVPYLTLVSFVWTVVLSALRGEE